MNLDDLKKGKLDLPELDQHAINRWIVNHDYEPLPEEIENILDIDIQQYPKPKIDDQEKDEDQCHEVNSSNNSDGKINKVYILLIIACIFEVLQLGAFIYVFWNLFLFRS